MGDIICLFHSNIRKDLLRITIELTCKGDGFPGKNHFLKSVFFFSIHYISKFSNLHFEPIILPLQLIND